VEKPNAIDQAQQAIIRAQTAVTRCRAALERAKDIAAQKRMEYQRLRAGTEENMVRTEILKTASAWRKAARTEEDDLHSSDDGSAPCT
jgi:multidrug resistance efflux pump